MIYEVQIFDNNDGTVSSFLPNILSAIEGAPLSWSLLSLWATGNMGEDRTILELEDAVNNSPNGLSFTFDELKELSNRFDQVVDALIIGCSSPEGIGRYENDEEMFAVCEVVIEMNDSTNWIIHVHDWKQVEGIKAKFENTEMAVV